MNFRTLGVLMQRSEFRIFWLLLPPLAGVAVITALNLEVVLAAIVGGLLVIVAAAFFVSAYRAASLNYETNLKENQLRNIMVAMEDALIVYDQGFVVSFFNPAAERIFRLKGEEVIGTQLKPQLAERDEWKLLAQVVFPSLAPTLVYKSRAGKYPQVVEVSFDDPFTVFQVTTAQVMDEHGAVGGFMKIIHDRTQEAELLKSKTEFIAVASHQLRTPITEVNWALQTLAETENIEPGVKDLIMQTAGSAKKILTIVEDLLSVARIEEGHLGYQYEETDLVGFLESFLGNVLPQVQRAGLKLYFDRPKETVPHVAIDTKKFSMVVSNLVDNAVRYNVPNGQIIVKVERAKDPRYVEINVKDTGIGIPPQQIGKLFTEFFRAENAVKFQTDGSGLGLYIAKSIIRAHGGQMWAESELNRGSVFHLTLPIDPNIMPVTEKGRRPFEPQGT